jgi:hypothetical protein
MGLFELFIGQFWKKKLNCWKIFENHKIANFWYFNVFFLTIWIFRNWKAWEKQWIKSFLWFWNVLAKFNVFSMFLWKFECFFNVFWDLLIEFRNSSSNHRPPNEKNTKNLFIKSNQKYFHQMFKNSLWWNLTCLFEFRYKIFLPLPNHLTLIEYFSTRVFPLFDVHFQSN